MRLKWRTAGDNTTAIPVLAGRSASQLEMRRRGGFLSFWAFGVDDLLGFALHR